MNKVMFDELLESVKEMDQCVDGKQSAARIHLFPEPEVRQIREKIGLSQTRFAHLIGVSKRTLENWEQGRRRPTGPAKVLMRILATDPKSAIEALHS